MKKKFIIKVENQLGVLYRLVNVFYRRKINILAINAFETKNNKISQVTITVSMAEEMIIKIKKQIEKIIEVISVQ